MDRGHSWRRRTVRRPSTTLVALNVSSGPRPSRFDSRSEAAVLRALPLTARVFAALDLRVPFPAPFAPPPASALGRERFLGRRSISESPSSDERPSTTIMLPSLSATAAGLGSTIAALACRRWRRSSRTVDKKVRGSSRKVSAALGNGARARRTETADSRAARCISPLSSAMASSACEAPWTLTGFAEDTLLSAVASSAAFRGRSTLGWAAGSAQDDASTG